MPSLARILLALALTGVPALAAAAPRTIDDCEKIDAADAYNRCLALFGPPARSLRLQADASIGFEKDPASEPSETIEPPKASGKAARALRRAARHASRSARQIRAKRMVFTIVSDRDR